METWLSISAISISVISACFAGYALKCQMRITRYTYLANKWYEIKEREFDNPDFVDPNKTASYSTSFTGKKLTLYKTFAWICWGHAEDIYLNKWDKNAGFAPSIKWYKELHYKWLKSPENSIHFKDKFIEYIDELK